MTRERRRAQRCGGPWWTVRRGAPLQSHELPLVIDVDRRDGRAVVALRGELDLRLDSPPHSDVEKFRRGSSSLVVDARALDFVDLRGLRYLQELEARARDEGWQVAILRGPAVERLSRLLGRLQSRRSPPLSLTLTARPSDADGGHARRGALSVMVTATRARGASARRQAVGESRRDGLRP